MKNEGSQLQPPLISYVQLEITFHVFYIYIYIYFKSSFFRLWWAIFWEGSQEEWLLSVASRNTREDQEWQQFITRTWSAKKSLAESKPVNHAIFQYLPRSTHSSHNSVYFSSFTNFHSSITIQELPQGPELFLSLLLLCVIHSQ